MKRGLMTQFPCARGREYVCKNIGDYVQTVATRQFVDPIDAYIEQEEADKYFPDDKEKIHLIMNGWFQWRAENWPPSEYIYPLLISMHISPLKANDLLKHEGVEFLKRYGPVGCRDYYTKDLLESKGIPAYFSACMTLTLGRNYSVEDNKHMGVCFVDPYFEIPEIFEESNGKRIFHIGNALKCFGAIIQHAPSTIKLSKNNFFKIYSPTGFLDRSKSKLRTYYKAALFYKTYIQKFSREMLLNASYITHWTDVKMDGSVTNDDLINMAEELIKKYASSRIVVTSRIHAGLPCLGVNTPVIFVSNEEIVSDKGTFNTPGRLGGLLEMFRIMTYNNGNLTTDDDVLNKIGKFYSDTKFENKTDWTYYADELARKATEFMEQ